MVGGSVSAFSFSFFPSDKKKNLRFSPLYVLFCGCSHEENEAFFLWQLSINSKFCQFGEEVLGHIYLRGYFIRWISGLNQMFSFLSLLFIHA
jgi:hypothetical protein